MLLECELLQIMNIYLPACILSIFAHKVTRANLAHDMATHADFEGGAPPREYEYG